MMQFYKVAPRSTTKQTPQSSRADSLSLSPRLEPWRHFVPLAPDLSDALERPSDRKEEEPFT